MMSVCSSALKTLLVTLALAFASAASLGADPGVSKDDIQRYNHIAVSREARVVGDTDNGDIAGFSGYRFNCRQQRDYSSPESAGAKAGLDRFMA